MPWNTSFGGVINAIVNSASSLNQELDCIHIVLDSYGERYLKEGDNLRETKYIKGFDITGMNKETPILQQLDTFWVSERNKCNIQVLCCGRV